MDKDRIKILLCSPCNGVVGGISKWTEHILKYYEKNPDAGVRLFFQNTKRKTEIYANTSKIKRIVSGFFDYIKIISDYKKTINSSDIDIVHITSSAYLGLLRDIKMLKFAKKKQIKTIIHFHFGRIPDICKTNNWERKLLNKVIMLADKVVVIDKMSYSALINENYKNVEYLPNPLSESILSIMGKNKDILREDRKLIFAGHVVKTKGVFELVEACKDIPDIKLKILGAVSADMKQKLFELAGVNSSKWLDIAGVLQFEDTVKEMLSAGVFVLPTYTEGFPNVIIESMACGCPIVASSVGAIPEMLNIDGDEICGICIEPKNVSLLRNAIVKMLNDRIFSVECGLNAQKRVKKEYSMPVVWNKLVNIWYSIVN